MAKYFGSNGVAQVDITGARTGATRTLKKDKDGFFNVESKSDAKALEQSGFVQASLLGVAQGDVGFMCSACGFNSFFAVCGRCGVNNKVVSADETKVVECDCDNCDGCDVSE